METKTGIIEGIKRLRNSTYGNPAFEVLFRDGRTYRTQTNGAVGYEMENGYIGQSVTVTVNHGRIIDIARNS